MAAQTLKLHGKQYILIPKREYERMVAELQRQARQNRDDVAEARRRSRERSVPVAEVRKRLGI